MVRRNCCASTLCSQRTRLSRRRFCLCYHHAASAYLLLRDCDNLVGLPFVCSSYLGNLRPPDELAAFRELRPDIGFGLGVIDVKSTSIETAEQVARSIERAASLLGAERIRYIHPDCGFWMLKRSIADGKIRALAAGRDLFEGRRA